MFRLLNSNAKRTLLIAVSLLLAGCSTSVTNQSPLVQGFKKVNYTLKNSGMNYPNIFECVKHQFPNSKFPDNAEYSFIIAGHGYGNPRRNQLRFVPTFLEKINKNAKFDDLFLTGDTVRNANEESYSQQKMNRTIANLLSHLEIMMTPI